MPHLPKRCFLPIVKTLRPRNVSRRGLSLTEMAIVVAIIGLVFGLIWAAASTVFSNDKVRLASRETSYILEKYRSLFSSRGVDVNGDITCNPGGINGVANGFFPQQMIVVPCVTGTLASYPRNPWGVTQVSSSILTQTISIGFGLLSQIGCLQYVRSLPVSPDIFNLTINGFPIGSPPVAGWEGACFNPPFNFVAVQYRVSR